MNVHFFYLRRGAGFLALALLGTTKRRAELLPRGNHQLQWKGSDRSLHLLALAPTTLSPGSLSPKESLTGFPSTSKIPAANVLHKTEWPCKSPQHQHRCLSHVERSFRRPSTAMACQCDDLYLRFNPQRTALAEPSSLYSSSPGPSQPQPD